MRPQPTCHLPARAIPAPLSPTRPGPVAFPRLRLPEASYFCAVMMNIRVGL